MLMANSLMIYMVMLFLLSNQILCDSTNGGQSTACGNGMFQPSIGEECDDGNTLNGDGCSSDCKIETGFICFYHPSVCSICGDGEVKGGETCDDGNTVNNDGCSSQCQIETGYTCSGSPSNCSICGDLKVGGTEECDDGNLINGDGCSSLCKEENTPTPTSSSISSAKSTSSSITSVCGNGKVENNEECDDGNLESGDGCNEICKVEGFYYCSGSPSICTVQIQAEATDKVMGITFQVSLGTGVSFQFFIASMIGQSLIGMWVMLNCLQLMRYLSLFALYLPKNLFLFLSYINLVNFQNQKLQDIYQYHINPNDLNHRDISNFRFVNQGIQSSSILLNCGDTFIIIILTIMYFILIFLFCLAIKCCKCNRNRSKNAINSKYGSRRQMKHLNKIYLSRSHENAQSSEFLNTNMNFYKEKTRCQKFKIFISKKIVEKLETQKIGLEGFIDLLFASLLDIKTATFKHSTDIYSSIVAFIWLILLSILFCFVFAILFVIKSDIDESIIKKLRYGVLLKDFKTNSTKAWLINIFCLKKYNLCQIENIIFLLRRVLIVFIALFIESNGMLQALIVLACCLIIIILKILIKPYKQTIKNIQDIISEVIFVCIISIFATFYSSSTKFATSGPANILGIVCIILIICIVILYYIKVHSKYWLINQDS